MPNRFCTSTPTCNRTSRKTLLHSRDSYFLTNLGAAGERQQLDSVICGHGFAHVGASATKSSNGSWKVVLLEDLGDDFCRGYGDQGGGFGAFPQDGVAANHRDGAVPTVDGDGEVEGGDYSHDS